LRAEDGPIRMMALRKYDLVTQDLCVALTGELPPAEHMGLLTGGLGAPQGWTNVRGVRRSLVARSKAQGMRLCPAYPGNP
jgi:hypothetical protein